MTDSAKARPHLSGKTTQISLPVLFASLMVAALFLSSSLLIWQGWQASQRALVHSAEAMTQSMGQLVDERARHFLSTASNTLHRLTHDPPRIGPDLERRNLRVMHLINALKSTPLIATVYVAYENGDFIIARQLSGKAAREKYGAPPRADYLLSVHTHWPDGEGKLLHYYYDAQIHFLAKNTAISDNYDPREREWYRQAMVRPGQYLSNPYSFFSNNQIGITLSEKSNHENIVVGLDANLSDLDAQLRDLRPTQHAEFAIVADGAGLIARTIALRMPDQGDHAPGAYHSPSTGLEALSILEKHNPPLNQVVPFEMNGETWFGSRISLTSLGQRKLNMLIAIPDDDLTSQIRDDLSQMTISAIIITICLMVASWFIGKWVGGSVERVTRYAHRLSGFDFSPSNDAPSRIAEFQQMNEVLAKMSQAVRAFLSTMNAIGSEPRTDLMLEKVLQETVMATGGIYGAVYLLNEQGDQLELSAATQGAVAPGSPVHFSYPRLPRDVLRAPHPLIGERLAGVAQLSVPLNDREGKPLGLLLLNYPSNQQHRHGEFRAFVTQLSGALSAAIETRNLLETRRRLFDGFVHLIADAIEAKSPYTGSHCRRVPELAIMMADRMSAEGHSPYGPYHLSEAERYAFRLGAWLHDCGKITSPDHIIDKATKLESVHNRIHDIRTRFEVLWRDAEIAHLRRMMDGANQAASLEQRDEEQAALQEDFAFIARCNIGGEFMEDADIERLSQIAEREWMRHFSDRIGLSREEEARLGSSPEMPLPAPERLLADKPEHRIAWDRNRPPVEKNDPDNHLGFDMALPELAENRGELHNLTIRRGTLAPEDRFRINDHVVQTFIMLNTLPWPDDLRRVPEIAATHHERMDGTGYPRRLDASRLTLEDRVMAIADVFEALTAADRPYKPAKPLTATLAIMTGMACEGHLDPLLMRYFLETRMWENYGVHYLRPEQRDEVDIAALVSRLPQTAPPPPQPQ